MPGYLVVIIGFCIAFAWVEIFHLGRKKPFSCLKCMCGWITLVLAYCYDVPHWYYYVFIGLFVGALFTAIKYRWL